MKQQFKNKVKIACQKYNDAYLKNEIMQYKKMKALKDEIQKGNENFFEETLKNARTIFRFRVELIDTKLNFKNKYRNESLLCDSCQTAQEENSHILFCPAYRKIREGMDINNDQHLALYIQIVLEVRMELRLNR